MPTGVSKYEVRQVAQFSDHNSQVGRQGALLCTALHPTSFHSSLMPVMQLESNVVTCSNNNNNDNNNDNKVEAVDTAAGNTNRNHNPHPDSNTDMYFGFVATGTCLSISLGH